MYLTNELQKHLLAIGSSILLYNSFESPVPPNYVYYIPTSDRNFRMDFGRSTKEYSIVLFIRSEKQNYEMCHLRGLFTSLHRLAQVVNNIVQCKK